jgi:hypothetical protein
MAGCNEKTDIIVHLVEKSVNIRLIGFCIIFDGETYCAAQEKLLNLIDKELLR